MSQSSTSPLPPLVFEPGEKARILLGYQIHHAIPPLHPERCALDYLRYLRRPGDNEIISVRQYTNWIKNRLFYTGEANALPLISLVAFELDASSPPPPGARCAFGTQLRPLVRVACPGVEKSDTDPWIAEALGPWLRLYVYWNTMTLYHQVWQRLDPRPPRPPDTELAQTFARLYYALDRWIGEPGMSPETRRALATLARDAAARQSRPPDQVDQDSD